MQPYGDMTATPAYQALVSRIRAIERRFVPVQAASYASRERRFRIGATTTTLLVGAGSQATVAVSWSRPFMSNDYQVDVAVPALAGQSVTNIVESSRTPTGCTVTFTVPALIALGTTVIVFAVSAPPPTQAS